MIFSPDQSRPHETVGWESPRPLNCFKYLGTFPVFRQTNEIKMTSWEDLKDMIGSENQYFLPKYLLKILAIDGVGYWGRYWGASSRTACVMVIVRTYRTLPMAGERSLKMLTSLPLWVADRLHETVWSGIEHAGVLRISRPSRRS